MQCYLSMLRMATLSPQTKKKGQEIFTGKDLMDASICGVTYSIIRGD